MRLLMLSGDRQSTVGERGPFYQMQTEFSRWFERIDVLCPRPDKPVTTRVMHGNVHLHPAPVPRTRMVGWLVRAGARLVAEHQPALIVSHDYGWFYNGIASARIAAHTGVPYLSEIHHVPGHPVPVDMRERFDRHVARVYVRWARSRARAFRVVNSVEMPNLLMSFGVPREQILVLPSLYIDLATFAPHTPAPAPERDVIFAGRLVANKNVAALFDALALCARDGLALRATLVGRGPLRGALEAHAKQLGIAERIEWIDWVEGPENLAELYRRSRALVCASTCEGGPRVTVEAMACGTPVISTPVGIMGELLAEGRGGVLCGFDGPGIARGLVQLLGDEGRRSVFASGARTLAERFEYHTVLAGYARGLHELVGEQAVRA